MSIEPVPLTPEILERFREALVHAGAPIGDEIAPGLSDEQIDRLVGEVGVQVPQELRTLWRWGSPASAPRTHASWEINPEFPWWPPARAIKETQNYRLDKTVPRTTIAFGGPSGNGYLLVEGNSNTTTSQVFLADIEDPDTLIAAPSVGALVQLWTRQLSNGDYRYDAGRWQPEDFPVPFFVVEN